MSSALPRPTSSACGVVVALLTFAVSARAQEGFGLDLTDGAEELRPNLAIIGSGVPQIDSAIVTAANRSAVFSTVLKPEQVIAKLGGKAGEAEKCSEDACLAELAADLDVERTLSVQVSKEGAATLVQLLAFHRGSLDIKSAGVDTSGPLKPDFIKKITVALQPLFKSMSAKLAHLKVTPSVKAAQVTLGSREFPAGPVDVKVSAGAFTLKVIADGYRTAQQQVALEEGGKAELAIKLVAGSSPAAEAPPPLNVASRPPPESSARLVPQSEPEDPDRRPSPPGVSPLAFLTHPGTYVALAGAVAFGVGGGLGNYAKSVQVKTVDANNNGILDVTRSTAMAANTAGLMGTVLMIAGGAALAGGGAWMFVAPPKSGGVGLAAGGKF